MSNRKTDWAENRKALGLCRICSKQVLQTDKKNSATYCWFHGVIANEQQRLRNNVTGKRRFNSIYYKAMEYKIGTRNYQQALDSKNIIEWLNNWALKKIKKV